MVTVDPKIYYSAAKACNNIFDEVGHALMNQLLPDLNKVLSGMGGGLPADVGPWNSKYGAHSQSFQTYALTFLHAASNLVYILNACGYNWDAAEYRAAGSKGPAPAKPADIQVDDNAVYGKDVVMGVKQMPMIPGSDPTSSLPPDPGLEVNGPDSKVSAALLSALSGHGVTYPNGSTYGLSAAAKAWTTFANSPDVTGVSAAIGAAISSFDAVDAPEKPEIVIALQTLQQAAQTLVSASGGIGKALSTFNDELNALRTSAAQAIPPALPGTISANAQPACVFVTTLDEDKVTPADITSTANDLASIYHSSALPAFWKADFEGCDKLDSVSDVADIANVKAPDTTGKSDDNKAVKDAIDAVTVQSKVDGVNDKGEKTTTITMMDGTKTVVTQTAAADPDAGPNAPLQPTLRYDSYGKDGKLISDTYSYKDSHGVNVQLTTLTDPKTGKQTKVRQLPDGHGGGTVEVIGPDGKTQTMPYTWFSHQVLAGEGAAATGAGYYSADELERIAAQRAKEGIPTTDPLTIEQKNLGRLGEGSKFIGPGIAVVGGILDVANGDNLAHAAGSTTAQIAGGYVGEALGALVPVPYLDIVTAAGGSVLGSEVGGWLFQKGWNATS